MIRGAENDTNYTVKDYKPEEIEQILENYFKE